MHISVVGYEIKNNTTRFTMRVEINGDEVAVEHVSISGPITVGIAITAMREKLLKHPRIAILRAAERLERDLENG